MAEAVMCFKTFDLNNSGTIGAEELAQVLKSLGHGEKEPEELRKMVRTVRSASQRVVGAEATVAAAVVAGVVMLQIDNAGYRM